MKQFLKKTFNLLGFLLFGLVCVARSGRHVGCCAECGRNGDCIGKWHSSEHC